MSQETTETIQPATQYISPGDVLIDESILVRDVNRSDPKYKELVESIKFIGTLLQPVVLHQTPKGPRLVCGRQRLDAARAAKVKAVPYVLVEGTDDQLIQMGLDENEARVPMSPIQEAKVLERAAKLLTKGKKKPSNVLIGKRLNRNPRWIADHLDLLSLDADLQRLLDDNSGEVTIGKTHELMRVHPDDRGKVINVMRKTSLTGFREALEKLAAMEKEKEGSGIRWASGRAQPRTEAAKKGEGASKKKVKYTGVEIKEKGAPKAKADFATPDQITKLLKKCEHGLVAEVKKKSPSAEEVAYLRGQIHAYLTVMQLPVADNLKDSLTAFDKANAPKEG